MIPFLFQESEESVNCPGLKTGDTFAGKVKHSLKY
jgi:hypothetical protein